MDKSQDAQRAMERALRSLSMRPQSEGELVEKLQKAGYDERAIAAAMAQLAKAGLVDDKAFAAQWTQYRAGKGLGSFRIAQELRHKGVQEAIIQDVLADMDEDDTLEMATALAERFLARGNPDTANRRAYAALLRRGYSYDVARQALAAAEALLDEEDEEDDGF